NVTEVQTSAHPICTTQDTTNIAGTREKIYDRNHKTMVDNKPLYSITYTPEKNVQAEKRLEVAEELAKYISMYTDKNKKQKIKTITERNKQEYWYLNNKEEADSRLSDEEVSEMDNAEQYKTILKRITKDEYEELKKEEYKN